VILLQRVLHPCLNAVIYHVNIIKIGHLVVLQRDTDDSEELIFRFQGSFPVLYVGTSPTSHGATLQTSVIFIFNIVGTSGVTNHNKFEGLDNTACFVAI
jgi:hypothetical protein